MSNNSLIVTTETTAGKQSRRFLFGIFGIYGLLAIYLMCFAFLPEKFLILPFGPWGRAVMTVIGVSIPPFLVWAFRSQIRGQWKLDDEGILFHSLRGDRQSLEWREVEAVFLEGEVCMLRSQGGGMLLMLTHESAERREEARQFMAKKLTAFDLSKRTSLPVSWVRVSKLTLLALAIGLLAMGAVFLYGVYLAPSRPIQDGLWWLFIPLLGIILYFVVRHRRQTWRLPDPANEGR